VPEPYTLALHATRWDDDKPGMYESPGLACRALGCYMVIGAGMWATGIALAVAILRRLLP
jgi:hypothetical protein